jgi:hypothetical protein
LAEGFTHGPLTDAELSGDIQFDEPMARRVSPIEDPIEQDLSIGAT